VRHDVAVQVSSVATLSLSSFSGLSTEDGADVTRSKYSQHQSILFSL